LFVNRKNILLLTFIALLAGAYVVFLTDWFRPQTIHISYTSRPARSATRPGLRGRLAAAPLAFSFGGAYQFTEIKVVPLAAFQTNSLALPLWHLVSSSNSEPANHFFYGQRIKGMKPAVAGAQPQPLEPGVTYRLLVQAGSTRGQRDFHVGVFPASTPTNR
jgi:hypothetical protein